MAKVESEDDSVEVIVCTESQPNWFGFVTLTIPVSIGLHDADVEKVESKGDMLTVTVTDESHPLTDVSNSTPVVFKALYNVPLKLKAKFWQIVVSNVPLRAAGSINSIESIPEHPPLS